MKLKKLKTDRFSLHLYGTDHLMSLKDLLKLKSLIEKNLVEETKDTSKIIAHEIYKAKIQLKGYEFPDPHKPPSLEQIEEGRKALEDLKSNSRTKRSSKLHLVKSDKK